MSGNLVEGKDYYGRGDKEKEGQAVEKDLEKDGKADRQGDSVTD